MSNFFTFGLNMRAGPSNSTPVIMPEEGCPLEKHPKWKVVHGATPSNMCWAS